MISNASANPPSEILARSGSTWALGVLMTNGGSVTCVAGSRPAIDGTNVVVVVATVVVVRPGSVPPSGTVERRPDSGSVGARTTGRGVVGGGAGVVSAGGVLVGVSATVVADSSGGVGGVGGGVGGDVGAGAVAGDVGVGAVGGDVGDGVVGDVPDPGVDGELDA